VAALLPALRLAACGVAADEWTPPAWLLPHQRDAAGRLATALKVFGGALLADAVGLGKSYVALALTTRYPRVTVVVPAAIRAQWRVLLDRYDGVARLVTHEALSRGARVPPAALLVVDEAHRFRNPTTRRYDTLARQVRAADVLLLTATPVVNRAADLVALVRLFLADHGLAALGVPSLEAAAGETDTQPLLRALSPLVVARSPESASVNELVPAARDAPLIRLPTVDTTCLGEIARLLSELRFPAFGSDAAGLLRLHLAARLASSPEALRESLVRHRTYLDRAVAAARRGERLSRGAARALFGPDESPQLDLLADPEPPTAIASGQWEAERARVTCLLSALAGSEANPKLAALGKILRSRAGRKTLVFTAARATAIAIGEALAWRRAATVSSRRARIASGPVSIAEAFALFAPRAQGAGPAPAAARVDVLVATDLASEGLNLQDADGVIHYDLPWTPLRLEQRLGRIARIGSPHRAVAVWWFGPPAELECLLDLTRLIDRKARTQIALGVPRTASVGGAQLSAGALERRERFAHGHRAPCPGHAVVLGPPGACAVIRWRGGRGDVWELVSPLRDTSPMAVAEACAGRPAAAGEPPADLLASIRELLRSRMRAAGGTDRRQDTRRLARRILTRGRAAARRRDRLALALLDEALARLHGGLAVGAQRDLADALGRSRCGPLRAWLQAHPVRHPRLDQPVLHAAVFAVPEAG
jgi:superfamily II DNA or RNA helicase